MWKLPLLAVLASACTTTSFADGASSAADFRFQKDLSAPTTVEVRNLNGSITVEPVTGDAIEVTATKTGRDLARVQIVRFEENGTLVFCAVWPGQNAADCRPGSKPSGRGENDVRAEVSFHLHVPSKIDHMTATTVNGAITSRSLHGDVRLDTVNGAIDVTANGAITATTHNGAVTARTSGANDVRLATENGRVECTLDSKTAADVEAHTLNGRVTSEFGPVPESTLGRIHDVKLRVGGGGTNVSLRTLNGDVRLLRGS